jgi:hypothetical protein
LPALTSAFWGVVVVLVGVVFALVGQVLAQRYLPLSLRESHNTAIGTIHAALYVMYALALALSLFIVWSEFREAQRTTDHEADAVGDLYQLARQFPEPESLRVQELSRSYARVVAKEEWPLLGGGREGRGSPRAQVLADELVERSSTSSLPRTDSKRFTARGLRWSKSWTTTGNFVCSKATKVYHSFCG